jgi:hypothetical protein
VAAATATQAWLASHPRLVATTAGQPVRRLLLVPALHARLAEQLAVLLLRHPLAPLLDDRTHVTILILLSWLTGMFVHMLASSGSRAHANATAYLCRGVSPGIAR